MKDKGSKFNMILGLSIKFFLLIISTCAILQSPMFVLVSLSLVFLIYEHIQNPFSDITGKYKIF